MKFKNQLFTCKICGMEFLKNSTSQKYCTECRNSKHIVSSNIKDCGVGICLTCNKEFTKNSGNHKRCKECAWKSLLKDNDRWNKSNESQLRTIYKKKHNKERFGMDREVILLRDNYTCCTCLTTFKSEELDIHHKDGNGWGSTNPNNNPSNLITICHSCHSKLHNTQGEITCVTCGKTVIRSGRTQKYCTECKILAQKESRKRSLLKKKENKLCVK